MSGLPRFLRVGREGEIKVTGFFCLERGMDGAQWRASCKCGGALLAKGCVHCDPSDAQLLSLPSTHVSTSALPCAAWKGNRFREVKPFVLGHTACVKETEQANKPVRSVGWGR